MRCLNSGCVDYTETRNNYCGRYADVTECDEMEPRNLAKPNAQPALSDGWRDARKETPANGDGVLMWVEGGNGSPGGGYILDGGFVHGVYYGCDGAKKYPIAWMPRPDPPAFA